MDTPRTQAEQALTGFLAQLPKAAGVTPTTPLFADGVGLDSLETAELSAVLEDAVGHDPFSQGDMPQTVAEILDYYGAAETASAG